MPAVVFAQDAAHIQILELPNEVLDVHPEDAIRIVSVGFVTNLILRLGSPLLIVVAPVTSPFGCVTCSSVGITQLDKSVSLVLSTSQHRISMALNDAILGDG